ncbi:hypothetical protein TWF481_005386 [Arthrobotrys musiformis]|uniref:Apple domain-containing protein n=1 Tax=Arthrobotrys musiformis TaxID=47236 RepID=A0AAV9WFI2_9PEZI
MVSWTFSFAAGTALLSLAAAAKPHRHLHLRRATSPSYTLVYSNVNRVPDFDDCIDYTTIEVAGKPSVVAKECASTADAPNTGAQFFAVYQDVGQKGSNEWWCGWWETAISDMDDVTEEYQEDGDEIYRAYGYNFTLTASASTTSSVKGSTISSVKGTTSASVKGTTSTSSAKGSTTSVSASAKGATSASASAKGTTTSTSTSVKGATSASTSGGTSSTAAAINIKSDSTSASKSKTSKSSSTTDAQSGSSSTTLKTPSTSSSGSASSSTSSSGNASSASTGESASSSSSTHTGKTKTKTSSAVASSSTGMSSSASSSGTDLSATPTTLAKKASSTENASSYTGSTSSTHTGKTKTKTSSAATSSSNGAASSTSSAGTDLTAPTAATLAKKVSSTGNASSPTAKASSTTGKVSSTTPSTTSSKPGKSSSTQTASGLSTQAAPTGVTTVTYAATATGIAGFSFVTGAVNAIPSQNILNYWVQDTNMNSQNPQVSCAKHCSSDASCSSFAVWAQQTWFNCAIYSVATTTSILQTSNMTTLDDGSISLAIIFNKGKDTNLSYKYSFENPKCGMKGYLWYEDAFADSGLDDIDDITTCANYCKSQSGCLTYEWQPSTQRCQTWNKDMFAAGYLTYDPTSLTFWYDAKCDLSKTLSPTFRNTRFTADQKTKYCGIKGNYNSAASVNTYKVYSVATADECGKWCHVYPVFNSYRWSTADGSCICQAPSIGMAVTANSSSTDVHYAMDCYSKMYYLYTDMTVL